MKLNNIKGSLKREPFVLYKLSICYIMKSIKVTKRSKVTHFWYLCFEKIYMWQNARKYYDKIVIMHKKYSLFSMLWPNRKGLVSVDFYNLFIYNYCINRKGQTARKRRTQSQSLRRIAMIDRLPVITGEKGSFLC